MASSLDYLTSNLVAKNEIFCDKFGYDVKFDLNNIDEGYVAHGKCKECKGYVNKQLTKDTFIKDFANLGGNHTKEQFRLLLRKGAYLYEYVSS